MLLGRVTPDGGAMTPTDPPGRRGPVRRAGVTAEVTRRPTVRIVDSYPPDWVSVHADAIPAWPPADRADGLPIDVWLAAAGAGLLDIHALPWCG